MKIIKEFQGEMGMPKTKNIMWSKLLTRKYFALLLKNFEEFNQILRNSYLISSSVFPQTVPKPQFSKKY